MTMYPSPTSATQSIGFVAFVFTIIFIGSRLPERLLKSIWFIWLFFCIGWYIYYFPNYQH